MSPKLVSVIGATGAQGGSLISALIKDPDHYSIRAITRNAQSSNAKALAARGIEVVEADVNSVSSLKAAFAGSYAVYAITDFFEPFGAHGPTKAIEIESTQGINIAKAAAATPTLEHYIWSTLPNGSEATNGKFEIPHFVSKNKVDAYIRSQPVLLAKTTFFWITFYAQNFYWNSYKPIHVPTADKYIQLSVVPADVPVKTIGDAKVNVGLFAKAALDQPKKTRNGRVVLAWVEDTTVGDLLKVWGKTHGDKKTEIVEVSEETFNTMWPVEGEEVGGMMKLWEVTRENSWTGPYEIVSKDELGVTGLLGLEESFKGLVF